MIAIVGILYPVHVGQNYSPLEQHLTQSILTEYNQSQLLQSQSLPTSDTVALRTTIEDTTLYTEFELEPTLPMSPTINISAPINTFTSSYSGHFLSPLLTVEGHGYQTFTVTIVNGLNAQIVTTDASRFNSGAVLPAGTNFFILFPREEVRTSLNPTVVVSAVSKYALMPYGITLQEDTMLLNTTKRVSAHINLELVYI